MIQLSCIVPLTVEQIDNCIKQLKFGKAARSDGLTAEHLEYAHPALVVHLMFLIHVMLSYGYVPEAFGLGLIVPLAKDKLDNHNKAENYKGITLTPLTSKLFESVIFQLTESKLQMDTLQFGFKKALAAQMLFYLWKCCSLFYITCNGSTAELYYAVSLDIIKSFDKVSYYRLFICLIKAGLPKCIIDVQEKWYSKLTFAGNRIHESHVALQ